MGRNGEHQHRAEQGCRSSRDREPHAVDRYDLAGKPHPFFHLKRLSLGHLDLVEGTNVAARMQKRFLQIFSTSDSASSISSLETFRQEKSFL